MIPLQKSIDISYAGHWGESGGNSTKATAIKLVDIYLRSFRQTQLLSMLSTHGCTYASTKKNRNIGWRADCYGDLRFFAGKGVPKGLNWNHMLDAYPRGIYEGGVSEAWKTAPVTFPFSRIGTPFTFI